VSQSIAPTPIYTKYPTLSLLHAEPDNVQCNTNINTFFRSHQECMLGPIRKYNHLIAISERSGKDFNPLPSHVGEFRCPELMPKVVVTWIWHSSVEPYLG